MKLSNKITENFHKIPPKYKILAGGVAIFVLAILDTHTKEITTTEIPAKLITEKTNRSVKYILEIENICHQNEILTIKKPQTRNEKISVSYKCKKQKDGEIPSAYGTPNPF